MSGHHHHHPHSHAQSTGRIRLAFWMNLSFSVIELIGGWMTGSVAIMADALHDLGDALSLGSAWFFEHQSQRGPTPRFSYGLKRLSLLSALVTGLVLVGGSVVVVVGSVHRLLNGLGEPHAPGMIGLAILGLVVNGFAAWRLMQGNTLNERMLSWHLIEDVMGWGAVLIGAICIYFWQLNWLDPILAVAISGFVSWNAVKNLIETVLVFLQRVPENLNQQDLRSQISALKGVSGMHDFHVWSLDGDQHVASMHLVITDIKLWTPIRKEVRHICSHFGIVHTTIECEGPEDHCGENCDSEGLSGRSVLR